MLKIYTYKPEQVGLSGWPSGELRLNGEQVTNASDADVFVYPGALHSMPHALDRLPYFRGNEKRHVFFHCSDAEKLYGEPALFIRCNTRNWYFSSDPNTISWPWPVNATNDIQPVDTKFKFDVSFHGWVSSNARRQAAASCLIKNHSCDFATYNDFYGHLKDQEELKRRRSAYLESLKNCKIVLCGESIPGVFPYRFFEAMAAGRIPALIGENYVLPFADEIPYSEFCHFIPLNKVDETGDILGQWLHYKSDSDIRTLGHQAHFYWERFLSPHRWVDLMTYAVEKKLNKLGLRQEACVLV